MSDRAPKTTRKPLSVQLQPLSGSKTDITARRSSGGDQLGANIVVEAANTVVIIVIAPFAGLAKLFQIAPRLVWSGLAGALMIFALAALDRAPAPAAAPANSVLASVDAPAPGLYKGTCDRGLSEGQTVDIEIFEQAGSIRMRRTINGRFALYTLQSSADGVELFHRGVLMGRVEPQANGLRIVTPTLFCSGVNVLATQARA